MSVVRDLTVGDLRRIAGEYSCAGRDKPEVRSSIYPDDTVVTVLIDGSAAVARLREWGEMDHKPSRRPQMTLVIEPMPLYGSSPAVRYPSAYPERFRVGDRVRGPFEGIGEIVRIEMPHVPEMQGDIRGRLCYVRCQRERDVFWHETRESEMDPARPIYHVGEMVVPFFDGDPMTVARVIECAMGYDYEVCSADGERVERVSEHLLKPPVRKTIREHFALPKLR